MSYQEHSGQKLGFSGSKKKDDNNNADDGKSESPKSNASDLSVTNFIEANKDL